MYEICDGRGRAAVHSGWLGSVAKENAAAAANADAATVGGLPAVSVRLCIGEIVVAANLSAA